MQWFRINVKVPQIDHFTLVSGRHTLTCLAMRGYHVCNLLFSNRGNGDKILLYVYVEREKGNVAMLSNGDLKKKKPFFSCFTGSSFLVATCGLSCPAACGILVPQPGIEAESPALEGSFLTTGLPGKSPEELLLREFFVLFL